MSDTKLQDTMVELLARIREKQYTYAEWCASKHVTQEMKSRYDFLQATVVRFERFLETERISESDRTLAEKNEAFAQAYGGTNYKKTALRDSMTGGVCPQPIDAKPLTKFQHKVMEALDKGGRLVMRDYSGWCFKGKLLRDATVQQLIASGELIEVKTKSYKGFRGAYIYHHLHRVTAENFLNTPTKAVISIEHLPKEIR